MARYYSNLTAICLVICVLSGCSNRPDLNTISDATTVTVYEGLPHQTYEGKLLHSEKKRKSTIDRQGFPFYEESLPLTPDDVEKLKVVLGNLNTFRDAAPVKKCGGFHPDFAVGWSDNGRQNEWLICFGCGECRLYGPSSSKYYDVSDAPRTQLKDILARYRQNRPPHYAWGLWTPFDNEAKILHPNKLGNYFIGKSTLKEILGDDTSESRESFAKQGLIFRFDHRSLLTGITVTSDEYPTLLTNIIVGMSADQIREILGELPSTTPIAKSDAKTFGVEAFVSHGYTFVLDKDRKVTAIIVTGRPPAD